jgi:chemotaxis protein MotB
MADSSTIIIKRRKAHKHAHHGGSWKVAYADFVTAMMAFFMVMWILGLSDQTRAQISGYFNDPLGYSKTEPMSRNIVKFNGLQSPKPGKAKEAGNQDFGEDKNKVQGLEAQLGEAGKGDASLKELLSHVDINVADDGLRIELVEDAASVFFDSGSAVITPKAKILIAKLVPILKASKRKMTFEGHTDAKPFGRGGYDNWHLSNDRALAMLTELKHDGIADSQILGCRGYGSTKLRFPKDPFNVGNRRVSILLPSLTEADLKKSSGPLDEDKAGIRDDLKPSVDLRPDKPEIKPMKGG